MKQYLNKIQMELKVNIKNSDDNSKNYDMTIDNISFHKMLFLFNAVNSGWSIKKSGSSYIFKKNHEGKKEIFHESYLSKFILENMDINKLLS